MGNEGGSAAMEFYAGISLHLVGIGGIGMSGLAQMLVAKGCKVSGSDRGLHQTENARIFDALREQGIALYEQNGSYINNGTPDALIYSTAIENDNPDFACALQIPRIHRAKALSSGLLMNAGKGISIAVTGSCGKTTVSAWLAEALWRLGMDPSFLGGGLANAFISKNQAGNYRHGMGDAFVFEADESDKSLVAYKPDYALVLNIGTDHYSKDELAAVFKNFLRNTRKGVVLSEEVLAALGPGSVDGLDVRLFSESPGPSLLPSKNKGETLRIASYHASPEGAKAVLCNGQAIALPMPGYHNAVNALAILSALDLLGVSHSDALDVLPQFRGVWRRFDYAGRLASGARVYDDYAHNVEKIISCMKAAFELAAGRVIALFQPHGFGPLGFMREELFSALEKDLPENGVFAMLPVYYAGGSSSFTPSSSEVIDSYQKHGRKKYLVFEDRNTAAKFLSAEAGPDDIVLIMGARDNSLSSWAKELCAQ